MDIELPDLVLPETFPAPDFRYEDGLSVHQQAWHDNGYVVLPRFIPDDLIDAYCQRWREANGDNLQGFGIGTPYMQEQTIKELCLYGPLMHILADIVSEPMGMNLNLTGWRSTTRNYHQDQYLNPACVGDRYAAVWTALDDIDPDAGPFEFVPGSHRWPVLTRDQLFTYLSTEQQSNPDWPWHTEKAVASMWEREISSRGAITSTFVANKGDVLIWHSRLVHRGSVPKNPQLLRKAMIAHYSGIHSRQDWPRPAERYNEGFYFPV